MRYAIVIEKAASNYSAYVPDLPGCVATGSTVEETEREIREAIKLHLEGLWADNLPVPDASSRVDYVEVAAWEDKGSNRSFSENAVRPLLFPFISTPFLKLYERRQERVTPDFIGGNAA